MAEAPSRDFDITWMPSWNEDQGETQAEPNGVDEQALLRAMQKSPGDVHVVDVAKAAGIGFDQALQGVVRLAASGKVEIVERDAIAGDHLVRLTPGARAA